jgi:aquaporin Z
MLATLRRHWPEYLIEAGCLGAFMVSACTFATLLGHPGSPLAPWLPGAGGRRAWMGLLMGLTAVSLIYSRWGKRSGAHMNPAVTFAAQFAGGIAGVLLVGLVASPRLAHPAVNYAVTLPGPRGPAVAFLAEALISFLLMTVILAASNSRSFARYTGLLAGALVALYITFESPVSGMSMNPARTSGSAFAAHLWNAWWVYFSAPLLGMLLAAETYVRARGPASVICAKLHHQNAERCIFRCGYAARGQAAG